MSAAVARGKKMRLNIMILKALTIIEPWASLIVLGAKQYETRSWPPRDNWRGLMAIHAGSNTDYLGLCEQPPFNQFLSADDCVLGAVAGRGTIDGGVSH